MIAKNKIIEDFFNKPSDKTIEKQYAYNFAITEQIIVEMRSKGWKNKDLAQVLGKKESEISKWLTGSHNLTTNTIAKISVALGKDIILTPIQAEKQYQKTKLVPVGIYMNNKDKVQNFKFEPNSYSTTLRKVS